MPARRVLDPPQTLAEAVQAMTDIKLAQRLSAVQNNGNSKDETVMDGLNESETAQPDQTDTRPPIRDSIIARTELRSSKFLDDFLPFEPPADEE